MSNFVTDANDPRLKRSVDEEISGQNEVYLVLSEKERAKGFTRTVRNAYMHIGPLKSKSGCFIFTTIARELAETFARDPEFYKRTYCCGCYKHFPVDEFVWDVDGKRVGS